MSLSSVCVLFRLQRYFLCLWPLPPPLPTEQKEAEGIITIPEINCGQPYCTFRASLVFPRVPILRPGFAKTGGDTRGQQLGFCIPCSFEGKTPFKTSVIDGSVFKRARETLESQTSPPLVEKDELGGVWLCRSHFPTGPAYASYAS